MVKEREEEMNNAENEYKVENVQDRFPNDDLQLNEKEKTNVSLICYVQEHKCTNELNQLKITRSKFT
jgi:hypothetical protein